MNVKNIFNSIKEIIAPTKTYTPSKSVKSVEPVRSCGRILTASESPVETISTPRTRVYSETVIAPGCILRSYTYPLTPEEMVMIGIDE